MHVRATHNVHRMLIFGRAHLMGRIKWCASSRPALQVYGVGVAAAVIRCGKNTFHSRLDVYWFG